MMEPCGLLLSLLQPGPVVSDFSALAPRDWEMIDAMARCHRLQPLLHSLHASTGAIPPPVRDGWAAAYRQAAFRALEQRRALLDCVRLLEQAGMRPIALKGAYLAWHAYPAAAMRPMRDIDLLLPADEVLAAWHLLRDAGHAAFGPPPDSADVLRDKHLPALQSPGGVMIELHMRCWESDAQAGHPMPAGQDAAIHACAASWGVNDPIRYPARDDMLAHLIIHGAYSHWLDAGPLMLTDIHFMLAGSEPDWPTFWQQAAAGGWLRGAAIILALVDRWVEPGLLGRSGCPVAVPAELLDEATGQLLQDMDQRAGARILARIRRAGLGSFLKAKASEAIGDPRRFVQLLGRRARETLSGLGNAETRTKSAAQARLGQWLFDS